MDERSWGKMAWPKWTLLDPRQVAEAEEIMKEDRSPLEHFLSPHPPPNTVIHGDSNASSPLFDFYQEVIDHWSATRAWVLKSEIVPSHEGPTWKLDVVFHVDDTPVCAQFVDDSDKMHGVGSDRVHDTWFRALMQTLGGPTTVFFEKSEKNCTLFGTMRPHIFWSFEQALLLAMETKDPEEVRELVEICLDIVSGLENEDLAWDAVSRSGRPVRYDDPGDWCRSAYTANRTGADLRVYLERMLPTLAKEGRWFWAAC